MRNKLIFTLAMILIGGSLLLAQTNFQLKNSKISILGTSNIHDWESAATQVKAEGKMLLEDNLLKSIPELKVTIAVEGIKSTKGSTMDKKTYKALLSETNPNIIFKLTKIASIKPSVNQQTLKASGNLTIAGTTKLVDLEVVAEKTTKGEFRFTGAKALKMTDFNMEPPTALFGTLKTGDDITVKFDITLIPSKNDTTLSEK